MTYDVTTVSGQYTHDVTACSVWRLLTSATGVVSGRGTLSDLAGHVTGSRWRPGALGDFGGHVVGEWSLLVGSRRGRGQGVASHAVWAYKLARHRELGCSCLG